MQIRNWLIAFLAVFIIPIAFAGCNENITENYVNVGWIEVDESCTQVSMALESQATFQIEYSVVPSNANNKKVSFTSADKSIASVDDDGVITANSVGETLITIRAVENSAVYATVRVTVTANRQQLSSPTGLKYDATTGKVVWNPVSVTNSSYIPSYKVKMIIDGIEYVDTVSSASYDAIQKDKVYELSVAAVGNSSMYSTSEYSAPITFAQLDSPSDIEIVTSTATRSYERDYKIKFKLSSLTDSIEDYTVDIKNLTSGAVSKLDRDLWDLALNPACVSYDNGYCYITIPNDLSRSTFGIRFMAKADESLGYYASAYSTAIQFARLTAPENLNLAQSGDNQVLTWSSVRYATGYKILFEYSMLSGSTLILTHIVSADSENPTSFDIADLAGKPSESEYSDYSIYIYAVGTDDFVSGVRYIDSARSSAPATKQLATVAWVNFEKDTDESVYHIEWSAVDNARTYAVYVSPTSEGERVESISLEFDRLVYLGTGARFDSSGNQISGLGCDIGFNQTIELNGKVVPVWTVGYNNIKIIAYPGDTTSSESVAGYIPSRTYVHNESFIKLATPTGFKVSEGKLVWDAVDYAGKYLVDFNNGKSPAEISSRGVATYEYSPSEPKSGDSGSGTGDMPTAGQTYNITLRATNEGIAYIDSDDTSPISASRYAAPAEIKVVDGNLTWSRTDMAGSAINAEWFEVRVKRDGEVVLEFETNMSVSITEQLAKISGDNREFEFSVRAVNTSTTGNYPYINGWWSESKSVNTYQLPTPQNVRVEDGVIKWDAFSDEKIAAGHTGIRFVLMVGSQKYGLSGSTILTINSTSAVIPSLSANSTTYGIKMQTVIESASAGDYGLTVGPDTYIINSGFTESFNVRQLPLATNVTVRDTTLYWTASNSSLNKYRIELYRINVDATGTTRSREDTPVMTAIVEPYDRYNPSWNFGLDFGIETTSVEQDGNVIEVTDFVFGAGAYQFVIYAVGSDSFNADNDKRTFGYLTSYESSAVEIYKLGTPTLDVDNGVVRWSSVSSKLGGTDTAVIQYTLIISCDAGEQTISVSNSTNSALDGLPATFYNKQLSIRIKALSSWSRVYDSELSAVYIRPSTDSEYSTDVNIVQKQPKILIDTALDTNYISIKDREVSWLDSNTDNRSYSIQISKKDSVGGINIYSTGSTSETKFEIPDITGGNFFLNIMRRGYVTEQQGADYKIVYRRLNSAFSDNIYIYRFYQPINLDLTRNSENNPVLKWSTGTATDNERLRFKIGITYVPNGGEAQTTYYYVPYNVKELDLKNGVVYTDEGVETRVSDYGAGMLSITIQAVRARQENGALLTRYIDDVTGNLIHLMDSQTSAPCIAYIYKAPDVTFEDGLINFNKSTSNVLDKGTQLIFTPVNYDSGNDNYVLDESGKVYVDIKAKVNTYDMSDLSEGVKYRLQLRALGDTKYNFTSAWEDCGYLIEKLAPLNVNTVAGTIDDSDSFDGWYLRDGEIYWSAREGASSYIAQVTNGSVVRTAFEITADASTVTYSSPISSVEAGEYNLQFTVVGGKTDDLATISTLSGQYTLSYVTSALSTAQLVTKLYAPNNTNISGRSAAYSRVVDGEFDWGIRDNNGAWVDAYGVTKYLVELNDVPYIFDVDGVARYFDAKEIIDIKGEYLARIYSIGNTWIGSADSGTPCLSSNSYGQFTLIYAGEDYNLHVENGTLNWNATSNGAGAGYDLQYELTDDAEHRIRSTRVMSNNYSFDGINEAGCSFDAIRVRYSGDTSTMSGALSGHVNTSWSLNLTNIVKLPDIEYDSVKGYMYVNEWGQLAWNYGSYYTVEPYSSLDLTMHLWLDIRYQGVSVGGNSQGVDIKKSNGSVYDVVAVDITEDDIRSALLSAGKDASLVSGGILKYNFYGYVAGSVSALDGEVAYLNSDTYERDAYKLDDPTTFASDTVNGPSLRVNWDISSCGVSGFDPDLADGAGGTVNVSGDKILFAYRMNGGTTLQYKTLDYVDLIGQIALWKVGFYDEIRLIVLNTAGQAFGSDPLIIENVGFEYFASGSGTGVDPFVIQDHDSVSALYQLELVYWLPELYFVLGQDIVLDDLTNVQTKNASATSNFPVPAGLNGANVDARYKELKFTGGFDGAGYTIKNFQTAGADSFGWWNKVEFNIPVDLMSAGSNFYYRGGIIKNLSIEAYSIDVSSLTQNSYSGLFTKENYGWIVNCNSTGAEKSDDDGYKVEVVSGKINATEVFVGGIAGIVGCYEETTNGVTSYIGDGKIEGCMNMLNIKINSADNTNYKSIVGGIVAYNYLGVVINCSNGQESMPNFNSAQVSGYEVGGIAGRVSGIEVTSSEGEKSYQYARISGCTNYGTVTSNSLASEDVDSCVSGGIAGNVQIGFVTYCINYGLITSNGYYPIIGGVVGYAYGGGFVLSCINMGVVRGYVYYSYKSADDYILANPTMGSLIGTAYNDSRLCYSYHIANKVEKVNNSLTGDNVTYQTQAIGESSIDPQGVDSVNDFTAWSESDITTFLTAINQTTIIINSEAVTYTYPSVDEKIAQFDINAGSNPVITWVTPSFE